MFSKHKTRAMVGVDIEAGSVAAAEVASNGTVSLAKLAIAPLPAGVFHEGEVSDPNALGAALKDLFGEHKLAKTVRLGVANQRVAVRTLRLPHIEDRGELETAIRFQAQDQIPMPLEQAVLDYDVVGPATGPNGERLMDVVAVAARRDMLGRLLDAVEHAGLRPVGIDVSSFGMLRALAPASEEMAPEEAATLPAILYCNLGDITNLAVARGGACLFTRVSTFGVEGIAQKLAERRKLSLEHARQWLSHVGLERPVHEIEGDAETIAATRTALAEGAARLADELRLSVDFYSGQEGAVPVSGVVACGPGTTIPGLVEALQRELGQPFGVGKPHALAHLDAPSAARATLAYGLALES